MRALALCLALAALSPAQEIKGPKYQKGQKGGGGVSHSVIDLSGLLAGPRLSPDAGEQASSEFETQRKMVLAAVDEIAGSAAARKEFEALFGPVVPAARGSKQTQPLADALRDAAAEIKKQVAANKIQVKEGDGMRGVAAYWEPALRELKKDDGGSYAPPQFAWDGAGTMGISRGRFEALKRSHELSYDRSKKPYQLYGLLFSEHQLADTVLHETAHVFYSYLRSFRDAKANPLELKEDFGGSYFPNHWRADGFAKPEGGYPFNTIPCGPDAGAATTCFKYHLSKQGYAADDGNEQTARRVAQVVGNSTEGQAAARVLEPLIRY